MMKQDLALAGGSHKVTQLPWGWAPGVLSSGTSRVVHVLLSWVKAFSITVFKSRQQVRNILANQLLSLLYCKCFRCPFPCSPTIL